MITQNDAQLEAIIRPSHFDEFAGQSQVKNRLQVAVEAARARGA